jgi:hypothetical protein
MSEMIWKIWKKSKLKCEMIWKTWKKSTYFSSIFFISFHYSTYLSSIFSLSFHNFLLYFPNLFTIQLIFLQYFPYHFTIQPTFLPHFPYLNIWKIQKKIVKRYQKYGIKVGWIVKWYGKYGRKVSRIVIRYGQHGRKASWNVKWYGKYGRNTKWKDIAFFKNEFFPRFYSTLFGRVRTPSVWYFTSESNIWRHTFNMMLMWQIRQMHFAEISRTLLMMPVYPNPTKNWGWTRVLRKEK